MSINWLSIDTSMNACGVGVRKADGTIIELFERMDRGQSEKLMPMVLEAVARAGLEMADIGAYAVTNGPGTFTGLRVGLATIRALAQVSGKPAVGVGTFEALAMAVGARPLCIIIETKRTDFYVGLLEGNAAQPVFSGCMSPEELAGFIKPHWVLAGDATERACQQTGCTNSCVPLVAPKSAHIIEIAQARLGQAGAGTVALPEPVYLRPADVSVSRQKTARIVCE